jgi:exopolyphosphatase / guanosine-5'-triphosphate,3'-diphosphate pyrophosphatase
MGVLDVGSNTVHLLLVDAHYGAAPIPASKHKAQMRLAEHIDADGNIDRALVDSLISFIQEGQELAEDRGATEIITFATSAIRDAGNGEAVIAEIRERTGIAIDVLSGDDEARLTFLAVRRWFGWSSGRLLVMDIGGGSLELAAGSDEEPDVAISLPLGAGRMTRDFISTDPADPSEIKGLRKHARALIADSIGPLRRSSPPMLSVATSKTFKQLARIAGAPPSSDGMYARRRLKSSDVRQLVTLLSGLSAAERAKLPGVSAGRSGQLLAGAIVAEAAMDLLEVDELDVCPWALREGVILRRMDALTP